MSEQLFIDQLDEAIDAIIARGEATVFEAGDPVPGLVVRATKPAGTETGRLLP